MLFSTPSTHHLKVWKNARAFRSGVLASHAPRTTTPVAPAWSSPRSERKRVQEALRDLLRLALADMARAFAVDPLPLARAARSGACSGSCNTTGSRCAGRKIDQTGVGYHCHTPVGPRSIVSQYCCIEVAQSRHHLEDEGHLGRIGCIYSEGDLDRLARSLR